MGSCPYKLVSTSSNYRGGTKCLVQGLSSHLHAKWATQNESQFVTVKLGALFGPDAWTGLVSSLVPLYPGGVQC
jgi:hypothetical protein